MKSEILKSDDLPTVVSQVISVALPVLCQGLLDSFLSLADIKKTTGINQEDATTPVVTMGNVTFILDHDEVGNNIVNVANADTIDYNLIFSNVGAIAGTVYYLPAGTSVQVLGISSSIGDLASAVMLSSVSTGSLSIPFNSLTTINSITIGTYVLSFDETQGFVVSTSTKTSTLNAEFFQGTDGSLYTDLPSAAFTSIGDGNWVANDANVRLNDGVSYSGYITLTGLDASQMLKSSVAQPKPLTEKEKDFSNRILSLTKSKLPKK